MSTLCNRLADFVRSEAGPTTTEYAVMIGVIVVGAIIALGGFGLRMNGIYTAISGALVPVS